MPPRDLLPGTQEHSGPVIRSRSSSISARACNPTDRRSQSRASRYSTLEDMANQQESSSHDATPIATTSDLSQSMKRAPLPPSTTARSSVCWTPTPRMAERARVQRWAGLTRSVCDWDGLRKDPDLWMQDGDCRVHLYGPGASRRGPSFCIPLRALRQKHCDGMLDTCYAQIIFEHPNGTHEAQQMHSFNQPLRKAAFVEIYIPAPDSASREEAFDWHITTRNFFAYVLGRPLVGRNMGQAFVDLLERMMLFRYEHANNHQEFLSYAENQGYRDLVECTDYALASLYYAEQYKLRQVWVDAFAHCVGMGDSIDRSPEYAPISRLTKALITRACLGVDIHLDNVARALSTFLHEDFSPSHIGLSQGARTHLVRFQNFLHDFYSEKLGYWPPPSNAPSFPKALYRSMLYDFKKLYDLLADEQSCTDIASQKLASGGICVLQNVAQFDQRHKFTPQMYPMPLLPALPGHDKPSRTLSATSHHKRVRDTSAALALATNAHDPSVSNSRIVQAYMQFERSHATNTASREDKLSTVDARKVRWLVIYGTLQYLTSVLRAPSAVRDVESPEYPLCCLIAGNSTWNSPTTARMSPICSSKGTDANNDCFEGAQRTTIEPDCNREDYINLASHSRGGSVDTCTTAKSQLPTRQNSVRTFRALSSLSTRGSRTNSLTLKPTPHCAILVQGYGNGLNQTTTENPDGPNDEQEDACEEISWLQPRTLSPPKKEIMPVVRSRGHLRNRTPLLNAFQLDQPEAPVAELQGKSMSRSDSTSSAGSLTWTDYGSYTSSKSSGDGDRLHTFKMSTKDGLLGGLVSVDGTRVSLDEADVHPLYRESVQRNDGLVFDLHAQPPATRDSTHSSIRLAFDFLRVGTPPSSSSTDKTLDLDSAPAPDVGRHRKSRRSMFFSNIITASSELRGRHNDVAKHQGNTDMMSYQHDDLCDAPKPMAGTPTVTKTSHATRSSSVRSRIWNDDRKLEKRMSMIWRR
ncbi:hypothetical protein ACEQ8H_004453 [Pleosporales sp. CAS-2024a]